MADNTSTGAPRVLPERKSAALAAAGLYPTAQSRGELLSGNYVAKPMSAIPTVLLRAFEHERLIGDREDVAGRLDEVGVQEAFATLEGARARALVCGGLRSHDTQAAALLVAIDKIDEFLDGSLSLGDVEDKLDRAELDAIWTVRDTMVRLLDWHMKEGGGALLPIAEFQGIVAARVRS